MLDDASRVATLYTIFRYVSKPTKLLLLNSLHQEVFIRFELTGLPLCVCAYFIIFNTYYKHCFLQLILAILVPTSMGEL